MFGYLKADSGNFKLYCLQPLHFLCDLYVCGNSVCACLCVCKGDMIKDFTHCCLA